MKNWEKNVRKVVPYVPGEQPKEDHLIKLNTNENPYPPSPKAEQCLRELEISAFRKYPDPECRELIQAISRAYGVPESRIFAGVGSDDVLAMLFLTFFHGTAPILFPDITYSFYDVWAELLRIPYETVPLDEEFAIRPGDYQRENGGIIFPNPNAPTGRLLSLDLIKEILDANSDSIVIVDEAYIDFGGESALPLIDQYENLIVVRTFSKSYSMAGMRIGYAFGQEHLISYLNDVKFSFNSYTMNLPALKIGAAVISDQEYLSMTKNKIIKTREWFSKEMRALGFSFSESASNFLFVTHEKVDAKELFEALKKAHIYVRHFRKPRIDQYLRITIGTDEEMQTLVAFLKEYL